MTDADLSTCAAEPITRLEHIQPFGFLLATTSDWVVVRASANLEQFLGVSPTAALGVKLDGLVDPKALHDIRNRMLALYLTRGTERIFGIALTANHTLFDVSVHQAGDLFVLEAELSGAMAQLDAASIVRGAIARMASRPTLEAFQSDAVRQIRAITGFDRVMIYRFNESGAGEVVAESIAAKMESYLGLHYPASDIPAQARALYVRNTFRIIADVGSVPVPLISRTLDALPMDLSLSVTRAVSPVHIEYLKNMGVRASMSISIVVNGELWGLFACHHAVARLPSFVVRTAAELLAQIYSLSLESRLRQVADLEDARLREATGRIVSSIVGDDALVTRAEWLQDVLHDIIGGDGTAIIQRRQISTIGDTPSHADIHEIGHRLRDVAHNKVYSTDSIASLVPDAGKYLHRAAGLLAIPISSTPRDYILLFRREALHDIRWAGNPSKPVSDDGTARISPRKSFAVFAQTIKGRSRPFSRRERLSAEIIRSALIEVILRVSENADEARQRLLQRQEVLIAELNHRVRNVLSLIRSVIKQSRGETTDIDAYVESVSGRIQSLARAHDRMTRLDRTPAFFAALLEDEIAAHVPHETDRVVITGAPVLLNAKAFSTMALVVHELVTNSCKHGALSTDGTVQVSLNHVPKEGLHIIWRERGGPAVVLPKRRGFGAVIIERTVPFDLHGRATLDYAPAGLEASFFIPDSFIVPASGALQGSKSLLSVPQASVPASSKPLAGLSVLIVEDNLIVALEAEDLVRSLGAQRVDAASSVDTAIHALQDRLPQFAMLDVNLGVETSWPIAARLRELRVPYIFASGYGDELDTDVDEQHVYWVAKPYDRDNLGAAIADCLRNWRP